VKAPSAPAGYSGTPLPKKLGIKEGTPVLLFGAPAGFERTLGDLPAGARLRRVARAAGQAPGLTIWFVGSLRDLRKGMQARAAGTGPGGLWICWPKKASGVVTDVSENDVRAAGLARGLVDYKIAAIDATWSGLKFARRVYTKPAAR
jgi:hypothetical protein